MPSSSQFDPITVTLEKRNLIEASAGTGKTYSIALLVVRLILEKRPKNQPPLSVEKILMVTFTNYAVAELESRVRQFVRNAYAYAEQPNLTIDEAIIKIVDKSIREHAAGGDDSVGRKIVVDLLRKAVLMLDELSIFTIHSFCRRTLTEFAFDTEQIFGAQALTGDDSQRMIEEAVNEFWRSQVTILRPEIIGLLLDRAFNRSKIQDIVKAALAGKTFYCSNPFQPSDFSPQSQDAWVQSIAQGNTNTVEKIITEKLSQFAIQEVQSYLEVLKRKYSLIDFEDMIRNLHRAVLQKPSIREQMRNSYQAVFIDEFQDTDILQYEIFAQLFGEETVLFYIGDPKQSIYGFRKADIHTYFSAKANGIDRELAMNKNYRSGAKMIEALNLFFTSIDDPFFVKGSTTPIQYIPVNPPDQPNNIQLQKNQVNQVPISVGIVGKSDQATEAAALTTAELLMGGYTIEKKGVAVPVVPSDIGILVRTGHQAKKIKERLAKFNIPAVTIDESKVLQSTESRHVLYLLEAVLDIKTDHINKALLSVFTSFTINDLLHFKEEVLLELFKGYQQVLEKSGQGVYVMMQKFMKDFLVRNYLLSPATEQGDRKLANIIQVTEILNNIQHRKEYSPTELVNWLKKSIEGELKEGNEYEQRIERDDIAVNILTVHKSKGLEYPIVIAPHLDMDTSLIKEATIEPYRDDTTGVYSFGDRKNLPQPFKDMRTKQQEQENRRLLYVAMTRAKYKLFIIRVINRTTKNTTLAHFIKGLTDRKIFQTHASHIQQIIDHPEIPAGYRYTPEEGAYEIRFKEAEQFDLQDTFWRKMSYSGLSPEHATIFRTGASNSTDWYDQFIFHQLPKGAHTGNLLHYIFEHTDFTGDRDQWQHIVIKALKRLTSVSGEEEALIEKSKGLVQMLSEILETEIPMIEEGFTLTKVPDAQKINELEFDYPIKPTDPQQFKQMAPAFTPWDLITDKTLQGIMNGKVDLFFEYGGKYYILDWKSNHLGYHTDDYTAERVHLAMNENNYHLQYHIYTLAVCQFLRLRKPDFDYDRDFGGVLYLFLRGVRKGNDKGIFYHKPERSLIDTLSQLLIG